MAECEARASKLQQLERGQTMSDNVLVLLLKYAVAKRRLSRINREIEAEKVQKSDPPQPQPRAERPLIDRATKS